MSEGGQRLRYAELAPEGVGVLRELEHYLNALSGLGGSLLEMVRLRASQMNGCAFCIGVHGRELERHHEPASRVEAVANWRESDAFTGRERAALRWTEIVTDIQDGHAAEEEFRAVREFFEEKELADLTLAIAGINAWNRMAIAFRPQWDAGRAAAKQREQNAEECKEGGELAEGDLA